MNWKDDKNEDLTAPRVDESVTERHDKDLLGESHPLIGDVAGQELQAGGEILITGGEDPLRDLNINTEEVNEPLGADRIVRAVQVSGDLVTNVLLVAVDKNDKVVGFDVPYGTEVIIDENGEISTGWIRVDGEFLNPDDE